MMILIWPLMEQVRKLPKLGFEIILLSIGIKDCNCIDSIVLNQTILNISDDQPEPNDTSEDDSTLGDPVSYFYIFILL